MEALRIKDQDGEVHLTDALHNFLSDGQRVWALELDSHAQRFDIGTPEDYEVARAYLETESVRIINTATLC